MLKLDISYLKNLQEVDWKGLLKLNHKDVLGLDIGLSAVKLVQLSKDDTGYTVTTACIAEITGHNSDDDGDNGQQESVVKAIRNCLSPEIKTRFAVCGVSGSEVAVRYFEFPSLSPDEIEGAVLLEASQVCPFNVSDGAVDYRLVSNKGDNACGFMVAASNKMIEKKKQLVENASLSCVLMDVDGLALLNCFNEYEKNNPSETTAILNVGGFYTTLAIANEDNLPFVRDIAYAGNDIINKIADEHDLPTETVRSILTGCDKANSGQLDIKKALTTASEKLATEITDSLRYYMAQENSSDVEKIFVCGGFALVEGFVDLLDSRLSEKVVLWNPFDKMRCGADATCEGLLKEKGPVMAVAAGLAMRSI